ncbi:hypothetical protein PCL1606_06320 [Pseudomonas chlororaphis]|uniref:Uncharacterized protein n=1 Tax=Pseudomonas chlororaphis TaxID=587753 RepID=A0A0D5XTL7_9PSED|nr:hypothetical protein PCL1606_06320 [Pseudomonas chlororaphis]
MLETRRLCVRPSVVGLIAIGKCICRKSTDVSSNQSSTI